MILFLSLTVIFAIVFYWYNYVAFQYWKSRNVKHDKPIPLFGTKLDNLIARKSETQMLIEDYYKWPNEKVIGWYRGLTPELVVKDPEMIQKILTTDFSYFYARGFVQNTSWIELIQKNLFFAEGDLWRLLRQRMTPSFTSGKLKAIFPLIIQCAERLQQQLEKAVESESKLDARDLMARFTTDFIGSCAFGIDIDSLNDTDSAFRKLGVNIFKITPLIVVKYLLRETMPTLCKRVKLFGHVEEESLRLVRQIFEQRDYKPIGRNDFIDMMLECRNKGVMTGESIENTNNGVAEKVSIKLTDELLTAQVMVFFAAGFETSSSATSFTLNQLAFYPEVQKKVQADIDRVLAKYDNKMSYDSIKEMKYLNWTFLEGLRIFPSLGYLRRTCVKPYKLPGTDFVIDKGVGILIPVHALHHDPKYFEDPLEFKPERFSPENFTEKSKRVYLPFGIGPRACIGERLGHMQSLAGLAAILSKFTVEPAADSQRFPEVDPKSNIVQNVTYGVPLNFRARKDKM